jgi:hypothetical protein
MYETAANGQAKQYTGQVVNAAANYATNQAHPPQPTRFSGYAGQLEARVAHIAGLVERLSRVADRLGGSVPEEAQTANKLRGNGGSIASQIENSLEDFDGITRRAERTVERLEQL